MKEPVKFITYHNPVYRVIVTTSPSQELTDDLVDNEEEQAILKNVFYEPKELVDKLPIERVYQRSMYEIIIKEIHKKFNAKSWYESRFSDGTWYVLYTAECELTGIHEAIYHGKRFRKEELEIKDIQIDLRVISLILNSKKCVDMLKIEGIQINKLVSQDKTGYPYCQNLAKKLKDCGSEVLKTPSARHDHGVCLPVLNLSAIEKDEGHLKVVKGILSKNKDKIKIFQEDVMYQF